MFGRRKNTKLSIATLGVALAIASSNASLARAEQVSQQCQSPDWSGVQASALLRGVARCARAPACRKDVAMQTERMAKRLVKLMTDFATGTMEQISELIGGIENTPDTGEVSIGTEL